MNRKYRIYLDIIKKGVNILMDIHDYSRSHKKYLTLDY